MSNVTAYGITIPVWDYLTGHEWEQVELIISDPPASRIRRDLLVLKVFVESRTSDTLDVDECMANPVLDDEMEEAVEVLTAPFERALEKRRERQAKIQASRLTPEALREEAGKLRELLKLYERAISEADGRESKASSGTTTPGSGSRGGGKGRSKKRSN